MTEPETATDVQASVDAVLERIASAADRAGRDAADVTLIAVTKTFPLATVRLGIEAGLEDFGENRVGELVEKSDAIPGEVLGGSVRWHAIGSLQRNKARDVAVRADLFHALDSPRLATALNRHAKEAGRVLPVLVQVNISGEASKSGVAPGSAHEFMASIAEMPNLRLRGVMGMAAPASAPSETERIVRPAFAGLRVILDTYTGPSRSDVSFVSMGMSGDFETAVEEGASHIRVGSALFGAR